MPANSRRGIKPVPSVLTMTFGSKVPVYKPAGYPDALSARPFPTLSNVDKSTLRGVYYGIYFNKRRIKMQTARIFANGRSQAVRLPKEFRFSGTDVYIKKIGNMVVLLPKDDPWAPLINSLNQFTDDFMQTRDQPVQDKRESL